MTGRALRGRDALALIAPACVWAAHFILLYALVSAACAPRALLAPGTLQIAGLLATLAALALALLPLARRMPDRALRRALATIAAISGVAILTDASILILFDTCGG